MQWMSVETILDLATSVVFGHASLIHRAANDPQELYAAAGAVPLDFLNDGFEANDRRPGTIILLPYGPSHLARLCRALVI